MNLLYILYIKGVWTCVRVYTALQCACDAVAQMTHLQYFLLPVQGVFQRC